MTEIGTISIKVSAQELDEMEAAIEAMEAAMKDDEGVQRLGRDQATTRDPVSQTSDASAGKYTFPAELGKELESVTGLRTDELRDWLGSIQPEQSSLASVLESWGDLRRTFCALGMELNRGRLFAPRFRLWWPPSESGLGSKDERDLVNDLEVLDLHWLFCKRFKLPYGHAGYASLLNAEVFDVSLASELVNTMGSYERKIAALELHEVTQCELAVIQNADLTQRWETICNADGEVDYRLLDFQLTGGKLAYPVAHCHALWKAVLLRNATDLSHAGDIAGLFRSMTGRSIDPNNLVPRLKRLVRALHGARAAGRKHDFRALCLTLRDSLKELAVTTT